MYILILIFIFSTTYSYSQDVKVDYKIKYFECNQKLLVEFQFLNISNKTIDFNGCLKPNIWDGKRLPITLYFYDKKGEKIYPALAFSLTVLNENEKKTKCYKTIEPGKSYYLSIDLLNDFVLKENLESNTAKIGISILYQYKKNNVAYTNNFSCDLFDLDIGKCSLKRI